MKTLTAKCTMYTMYFYKLITIENIKYREKGDSQAGCIRSANLKFPKYMVYMVKSFHSNNLTWCIRK